MVEKNEFDVGILKRGSLSPDPEQPSLQVAAEEVRTLSLLPPPPPSPSTPPPSYTEQDGYFPGLSENFSGRGNWHYGNVRVNENSDNLSPSDQPYSTPSDMPSTTSTTTRTLNPTTQVVEQVQFGHAINFVLRPLHPPPHNRIRARRNRGDFRSEYPVTSEKTCELVTAHPAKKRRFHSRTYPADASTHPYLDECYTRPYGYNTSHVSSPSAEHQPSNSIHELRTKLDVRQWQSHSLQREHLAAKESYDRLESRLPWTDDGNWNMNPSVWGEKEQLIYQRLEILKNQILNIERELEIMERVDKGFYEELKRLYEARKLLEGPIRTMAIELEERAEGRRWLTGEIPWQDGIHLGRNERYFTPKRRLSY